MKIFAVSDLHLSWNKEKPMEIFGGKWENHFEKIKSDWLSKVGGGDVVLVCGDVSWGITMEEGLRDLESLKSLPGKKVFVRGNHDYWWNGITKLRNAAPDESFYFLQNDCVKFGGVVICGSRGWTCPGSADFTPEDEKLYLREAERFKLCFKAVNKVRAVGDKLIVMIHYPPFSAKSRDTLFTELFKAERADAVVFGHLHGEAYFPLRTVRDGAEYVLTSCDKTQFKLQQIM